MGQPVRPYEGSSERPGEESPVSGAGSPGSSVSLSSPGHSGDPPAVWHNVTFYRLRAEEFGDLASEMIAEGLDGLAYGAARKAAHYGRFANALYRERATELIGQHPEWLE